MNDAVAQVLAVGAGPTGLLLAAELERRDVPCLLIDELDAPRGWDRATVVHERSLEIFEALGIVESLLAAGVRTRGARLHSDGEFLGEVNLSVTGSRYGYQLGLSEEVTEAVLTEFLEAHGGRVTRATRLEALEPRGDGVSATLASTESYAQFRRAGSSDATGIAAPSAPPSASTTPAPTSRRGGASSTRRSQAGTTTTTSCRFISTCRR